MGGKKGGKADDKDEYGERGGKGKYGGGKGHENVAALIEEVKSHQRSTPGFREAWQQFCMANGTSKMDPTKHDAAFVARALNKISRDLNAGQGKGGKGGKGDKGAYGSGSKGAAGRTGGEYADLVATVKERQESLPGWKQAWWHYCDVNGGGNKDPARHDIVYLKKALSVLSSPSEGAVAAGTEESSYYASPEYVEFNNNDPERATLIAEVKERQRFIAGFKEYWKEFCRSNGVGAMDPSRHSTEFLQRGLLPPAENHRELINSVKQLQRTDPGFKEMWVKYCHEQAGGRRDPTSHTAEFLTVAIRELAGGRGLRGLSQTRTAIQSTPTRAPAPTHGVSRPHMDLITNVKRIQKESPEARLKWVDFCGRWGSSDLDPARHNPDFLKRAMTFMQSDGQVAAAGGDDMWGKLRNVLGYDTTHIPSKEVLVAAVKRNQRASNQWRARWWEFCDKRGNGDHDPARHPVQLLQDALKELGDASAY